MIFNRHKKMAELFTELCDVLKVKLERVDDCMEFVQEREYRLALDFISAWCVDVEPELNLTASELLKIKEVADKLQNAEAWIALLPLLAESEMELFPINQIENIEDYLTQQLAENPLRKEWLVKVQISIQRIKNLH